MEVWRNASVPSRSGSVMNEVRGSMGLKMNLVRSVADKWWLLFSLCERLFLTISPFDKLWIRIWIQIQICLYGRGNEKLTRCFWGYTLQKDSIAPQNETLCNILNTVRPKTKKECRHLFGVVNFYRRYIPNCAEIIAPITDWTDSYVFGQFSQWLVL